MLRLRSETTILYLLAGGSPPDRRLVVVVVAVAAQSSRTPMSLLMRCCNDMNIDVCKLSQTVILNRASD